MRIYISTHVPHTGHDVYGDSNVIKRFSADLKIFWNPLKASALEKAKADYIQRGGKRDISKF